MNWYWQYPSMLNVRFIQSLHTYDVMVHKKPQSNGDTSPATQAIFKYEFAGICALWQCNCVVEAFLLSFASSSRAGIDAATTRISGWNRSHFERGTP